MPRWAWYAIAAAVALYLLYRYYLYRKSVAYEPWIVKGADTTLRTTPKNSGEL